MQRLTLLNFVWHLEPEAWKVCHPQNDATIWVLKHLYVPTVEAFQIQI